jgi:DNA-3-methyladenine glycosylase II
MATGEVLPSQAPSPGRILFCAQIICAQCILQGMSEPGLRAAHESELTIKVREPFEWAHSLRFISGFPPAQGEQVIDGARLVKAWRLAGQTVAAQIQPAADGGPALDVTLASPAPVTDDVRRAAADRVPFYLSADDDLRAFDRTARQDPGFAPVAARLRGYHQVKFGTPAENLVWAVLAQRSPMRVAREAKLRLMQHLNEPVSAFGTELLPFPSVDQLAALPEAELAGLVGSERKGAYLAGTVRRLLDIDESFLRHADYRQVQETLQTLPGIGPWSAVFVMIRGLGRTEVLPQEPELVRAASKAYGRALAPADLVPLAEPYAPYQGYWAHYLRAGS